MTLDETIPQPTASRITVEEIRQQHDAKLAASSRYQRVTNYLAAAQIYLKENVLLEEPLKPEHIKDRLLGHWGTSPGINLIYAHLNQLIMRHDLDMFLVTGPGHGAPANLANLSAQPHHGSFVQPTIRIPNHQHPRLPPPMRHHQP